jgi:type III pantothenate kinase
MLLAIDVGNTNIVLGVFRDEDGELVHSWRLTTLRERTADELGILITSLCERHGVTAQNISGIVIASVVPPLTGTMMAMVSNYFGRTPSNAPGSVALNVEPALNTGMPILYDNPHEVGADRVVNGVAAYEQYGRSADRAVIVVDFGTATTFDAISARGEYLGGVICPGPHISADALFQRAARLPRIDVRKPERVIGRTTVGSMQSGLFWGYVDMVEGLVKRMRAELGGDPVVVATGGLAVLVSPETSLIDHVDADLTLRGLRLVWQRNQESPLRGS